MIDVDGVLVRGRPADGHHWTHGIESGLGISAGELQTEFFLPYWDAIVLGRADLVACLTPVLKRIAPHLTANDVVSYWFAHDSRLDMGLLSDLAGYRSAGIPLYLATNQDHRRAQYLMNEMGLADHFDGIIYSAEIGYRKPDRAFYDTATLQAGFDPSEILLIDDMQPNVDGARASDWYAVRWTGNYTLARMLEGFDIATAAK